jgi:cell division protein ZapA
MAEVELNIGGREHIVACRDGGEAELAALGRRLDAHAAAAIHASGAAAGERMMVFVALMLADELAELERKYARDANAERGVPVAMLDELAARLEAVATGLEESAASP